MSPSRAVVYCRVSTEDQAENGTGLETQELACLRRASELGCAVHATLRDEGVSGALYDSREGIQRALDYLEAGDADVLIVHSISRLSRDLEHQQAIRKRVVRAGARLVVCDLPSSDTEEGDLMFGITGAFAQYERKLIRKRTMAGSQRMAEKGRQPVRAMCPFGYRIVTKADVLAGRDEPGTEGTYVVTEPAAEIVRSLFDEYASGAVSLYGLASGLNARRVPTPRKAANWSMQTIAGILKNPIYKGQASWGRHCVITDEARKAAGRNVRYKRLREAPTVVISVPPIVDEATWQTCQERLAGNKRLQGGNPNRTFLLSGVAHCPECGRGMTGKRDPRTGKPRYRCNRDSLSQHRPSRYYPAEPLEELTIEAVLEASSSPESIRAAHAAWREMASEPAFDQADDLRSALAAVMDRERVAAQAQVDALLNGRSAEPYEEILRECQRERQRLEGRLKRAGREYTTSGLSASADAAENAIAAVNALHRVLTSAHLTNQEKRSAISGFVSSVIPGADGGVEVVIAPPLSSDQKNKNTHQFFIGFPASSLDRLRKPGMFCRQ